MAINDANDFGAQVNFQVTVLKILVSYPDGFAQMEDLKRDMAILATSGRDWAERTKRLGARVPDLNIFSQALIERVNGGWRITQKGRSVLELMEARAAPADTQLSMRATRPAEFNDGRSPSHRCCQAVRRAMAASPSGKGETWPPALCSSSDDFLASRPLMAVQLGAEFRFCPSAK